MSDPLHPDAWPRRALVAALGLAPQVVTETLWALAQQGWRPTEIHIVTTLAGKARAEAVLLGPNGTIAALARDWGFADISAAPVAMHVIGGALNDIDSGSDNLAAADLFASVIGGLSADAGCAIHVSIAGGRKTMGFLAGYALSLFGRPQDRLSHVLVRLPFQNLDQFHFPPREDRTVMAADGAEQSSADAALVLADIPFVRLRAALPAGFLDGAITFSQAVDRAQKALQPPSIHVDLKVGRFACNGVEIPLAPVNFAFAAWLAQRCRDLGPEKAPVRWNDQLWHELAALHRSLGIARPARDGDAIEEAYFRQRTSRISRAIKAVLGGSAAPFLPMTTGQQPSTRIAFGLRPYCVSIS